ncbi:MAG: cobalamin B12-binding domain-containing protein, partial [archaeon]
MTFVHDHPDICLISLPSRAHSTRPPLGLMTICSYLEKRGISVELIDLKVKDLKILELDSPRAKELEDQIVSMLKQLNPPLVGMGTYTHEVDYTLSFAKRIKSEITTKIIVGGQHSSLAPDDFIFDSSPIDYAVIGEGEETFRELTRSLLD